MKVNIYLSGHEIMTLKYALNSVYQSTEDTSVQKRYLDLYNRLTDLQTAYEEKIRNMNK